MKKTENYEVRDCTFTYEGGKLEGVYIHDINDEFGNGDGVTCELREADISSDRDVLFALDYAFFTTDFEVLDTVEFDGLNDDTPHPFGMDASQYGRALKREGIRLINEIADYNVVIALVIVDDVNFLTGLNYCFTVTGDKYRLAIEENGILKDAYLWAED